MALGTHNRGAYLQRQHDCATVGQRVGRAVMAYVLKAASIRPTGHMRFAGTITLPDPIFRQVLEYAARSLKLHGFRDIVF